MDARKATNAELDDFLVRRDEHGPGYAFETISDLIKRPEAGAKDWLIKGVIARGETSAWIAPPGGMKSALMAELAIAVADVEDWHGYKHGTGAPIVVYFALERADLVRRRLSAHLAKLALKLEDREDESCWPEIIIVPGMVALRDANDTKKVITTLKNIGEFRGNAIGLIIFDTFAKLVAAGGGDEDKAKDQGAVFANIQRIKDELWSRPHVALVGHTGKDESRGSRGSNAILGDVDVMVTISGDTIKTATVTKANDAPEGPLFSFMSEVFEFGTDKDGAPITVNIVSSEDVSPQVEQKGREPKLTANQKTVFAMLHAAGKSGLLLQDWNNQAREAGIGVKRKADLNDIRTALLSKGLIRQYGDRWTVVHDG